MPCGGELVIATSGNSSAGNGIRGTSAYLVPADMETAPFSGREPLEPSMMGSAPVQMPSEHPAHAPSIAAPTNRAPERSRNLWRLRPYLRPHRWRLAVMFSTAMLGVAVSLTVPLVTRAIIDGPVTQHELSLLVPLALLALGLSIAEVLLVWARRWAQSRAVSDLEAALRQDLYIRLQRLPIAFHDRWQSRPAAVPGHHRPVDHPPVPRLRADLPGDQLLQLGRGHACCCSSTGRSAWSCCGAAVPDHLWSHCGSSTSTRRLPQDAGPARRPRHPGRGVGARHPGDQGVRPAPRTCPAGSTTRARNLHDTAVDKAGLSARFWTFLDLVPERDPGHRRCCFGALAVGRAG